MKLSYSLCVYRNDSSYATREYFFSSLKELDSVVNQLDKFYLCNNFHFSLIFLVDEKQVNQIGRKSFSSKIHLKNWLFKYISYEEAMVNPEIPFIYFKVTSSQGDVDYENEFIPKSIDTKRALSIIEMKAHNAFLNNDLRKIEIVLHSGIGVTQHYYLDNVGDLKTIVWQKIRYNCLTFSYYFDSNLNEEAIALLYANDKVYYSLPFSKEVPFFKVINILFDKMIFNNLKNAAIGIIISSSQQQILTRSILLDNETSSTFCKIEFQKIFTEAGLLKEV